MFWVVKGPLKWGKGRAYFPPGTAFLGHGEGLYWGPADPMGLAPAWGGSLGHGAMSWCDRAETLRFGSSVRWSCHFHFSHLRQGWDREWPCRKGAGRTGSETGWGTREKNKRAEMRRGAEVVLASPGGPESL